MPKLVGKIQNNNDIVNKKYVDDAVANSANYVIQLLDRENNYMVVRGTDNTTYNMSSAWTYLHINMNTVDQFNGNLLTFSNNHIVIGAGVTRIRVSGLIGLWGMPNTSIEIHPRKNDSSFKTIYYTKASAAGTEAVPIPPIILDVNEGDTIDVSFTSGYTGSYKLLTRSDVSYLLVEVVGVESQIYGNSTNNFIPNVEYPINEFIAGKRVYTKYVTGTSASNSSDTILVENVDMIIEDNLYIQRTNNQWHRANWGLTQDVDHIHSVYLNRGDNKIKLFIKNSNFYSRPYKGFIKYTKI